MDAPRIHCGYAANAGINPTAAKEQRYAEQNYGSGRYWRRHFRRHRHWNSASPPPHPAKATSLGGYTYTQRVCQEYGKQPRWYNVRDGQAAYNGGNSDSGWLIVLERGSGGGGAAAVAVSYPESSSGSYVKKLNSDPAEYFRFTPDAQGDPQRIEWNSGPPGYFSQAPLDGPYVRIGPGWNSDAFVRVTQSLLDPLLRYDRTETPLGGGSYIRWAHIEYFH